VSTPQSTRYGPTIGCGRHALAAAVNISGAWIAAPIAGLDARCSARWPARGGLLLLGEDHGASWQHLAATGATVEAGLVSLISAMWRRLADPPSWPAR
jgi:hypothetical protein